MLISHSKKFIFIKTEKTASSSCELFLRQFCTGSNDIVTPLTHEKLSRELGLPKPKNYLIRENKYFQHFLTELDYHQNLRPYLPARFSRKFNSYSSHSTASDVFTWLESFFDMKDYYKFGFTREPASRFKSYLKFKSANIIQSTPSSVLEQNFINCLKYKFISTKAWFHDNLDKLLVDKVYKFEDLNQSMDHICEVLGFRPALKFKDLPILKDSKNYNFSPEKLQFLDEFVFSESSINSLKVSHAWEYTHFYSQSFL